MENQKQISPVRRYFRDCLQIIRLGFPVLVSQIGMIVVGFADNIMVGHYSTDALASASFVNNIFNLPLFAAMGFSYGLTPLIGALFAKGDSDKIGKIMKAGVAVNLLASLLMMLCMGVVYLLLPHLGQPEELLPVIRPYFLIYLVGMVPVCLFNVFAQWSYGIHNTAMPMWIMLVANVINVLFNFLLIFGKCGLPELGLTGAGIATLMSRVFCATMIAWFYFRAKRYRDYAVGYHAHRLSRHACGEVFRMSWPISLQMSFETAAFSGCALLCGWLGAVEMAAYQIIVVVGTLGFCIYYAMATAVSVLVANEMGANNPAGMKQKAFAGYGVILAACTCSSLFFGFGAEFLMHIFTNDPAVLAAAIGVIIPLVLYQLGDATQINFASCLRGSGNVKPMMWIAFVSYMIVGIPSSYLLAFTCHLGLYGIVLSFSCSLFLAAALFLYFFLRGIRRGGGGG
jgi:MATE family multidrug resistance protein